MESLTCLLRAQPPGESAKVPLCTDVGPWAQDHHEIVLLRQLDEALNVLPPVPSEVPWVRLVLIPGDICLQPQLCLKEDSLTQF